MNQTSNSAQSNSSDLPKARRRKRNPWPSLLAGAALLALAGFLAFGSLGQSLEYFKTPSEYQLEEHSLKGKTLRLGGLVKNAQYDPQTLQLNFEITDGSVSYPVHYQGAVSDLFSEGQGVIVRGRFSESGQLFEASELIVKHSEEYKVPETKADIDKLREALESAESSE